MSEEGVQMKTEVADVATAERPSISKTFLVQIAVGVIVVGAFLVGGFMLFSNPTSNATTGASDATVVAETDKAIQKIGRLIALPEGETPTLATVSDPEQLKDQPFFANAQPGFQVLLYPIAQKAFLYDPAKDIIVEVATLNLGQ